MNTVNSPVLSTIRIRKWLLLLLTCFIALPSLFWPVETAQGAGVVGSGTPASCTQSALNVALSGGGLVTFNCGPNPHTIVLTAQITIDVDITIDGGGLITVSGGDTVTPFYVSSGYSLTLQNLTITHGWSNGGVDGGGGGGVYNEGTLHVINSTFSYNNVLGNTTGYYDAFGGGILNDGTLNVTNSSFLSNTVQASYHAYGAGIYNTSSGDVTIANSTFSDNVTIPGDYDIGDPFYNAGTFDVTNSTFSGGQAYNSGAFTVTNGTFSVAEFWNQGSATFMSSIVAGGHCYLSSVTDGGYNVDSGTSCDFSAGNNSVNNTDAMLGALADNGGPTLTHALSSSSPILDHIPPGQNGCGVTLTTDQRGMSRPAGDGCDIGAYERHMLVYLPLIAK